MSTWSRARIRDHHSGLPTRWNFDGIPVGLIGYRNFDGTPLLAPGPALCEWNRRRVAASEEQHSPPDWRCECGDLNRWHEAFCYRCGAGQPEGNT